MNPRCARTVLFPALLPALSFLVLLLVPALAGAQDVDVVTLDASTSLLLRELGAVTVADGDAVVVEKLLPAEIRPEAYRKVDVREGDVVMMINGERIHSLDTLRAAYDALAVGAKIKLGMGRGDGRFLVKLAKAEPEAAGGGPGVHMVRMTVSGDEGGGDVELLPELHALLGDRDGLRVVAKVMESDLHEDDAIVAIDGKKVDSLADFRAVYGALATGAEYRLSVHRGDADVEVESVKQEFQGKMMLRREQ